MDTTGVFEILTHFGEALERNGIRVMRMILFGSYATGTQSEWSDIDVVVISTDFQSMGRWDRAKVLANAVCEVLEPIEAVAFTPEEWEKGDSMLIEAIKSGKME